MTWPLVNPTSGYKTLSRFETVRLLPSTSMTFSLLGIGTSLVGMMPPRLEGMQAEERREGGQRCCKSTLVTRKLASLGLKIAPTEPPRFLSPATTLQASHAIQR